MFTMTMRTDNPTRVTTVRNEDIPYITADSVRWGAVIAGLFAAITSLIVLSVAGLAIGLSTFQPGAPAGNVLVGTGIWGAVSVLIAFFVGGGTAARTSAVHGRGGGALNGAIMWMVAIPLLVYTLLGGVGSLLNTVTSTASTAVQAIAPGVVPGVQAAATTIAGTPGLDATAQAAGTQLAPTVAAAATAVSSVPAADVKAATNNAASAALSVLLWLGLGLLASVIGGTVGARSTDVTVTSTVADRR
jgi:hypothetical protein